MKKILFYFFLVCLSTLMIFGYGFAEDLQLPSYFMTQHSSETRGFLPIKGKDIRLAFSIHHVGSTSHSGKSFIFLDMKKLKRESEINLLYNNASENPSAPNTMTVLKMAFDEIEYLKKFRGLLDGVQEKVEHYGRKFKLKGEVGITEQSPTWTSSSAGKNTENTMSGTSEAENFLLNLMPERISWSLSSDLDSNYLKGNLEIGSNFVIEGGWGADSDVKAMFTYPF